MQSHTALMNVARVLAAGGATCEFVDHPRLPTSSLVQVAGLVHPDLLLEVEAVA